MTPTDARSLLERGFGLHASAIERATGGHTNETWLVTIDDRARVLRVSWPNKPIERARREEAVLERLRELEVPRVVARATVDGRTLHLFERIDGEPLPMWLPQGETDLGREALHALRAIHDALEPVAARPTSWLRERLERVRPGGALPLQTATVLARIGELLDEADERYAGPTQWLHGDFHLGNLLRTPRGLAVLDFDDVGVGSAALEGALASCAITRIDDDDRLRFRADAEEPLLFAASQVLVHLEAAQRGSWQLGPGIGFLACWRALTSEP